MMIKITLSLAIIITWILIIVIIILKLEKKVKKNYFVFSADLQFHDYPTGKSER